MKKSLGVATAVLLAFVSATSGAAPTDTGSPVDPVQVLTATETALNAASTSVTEYEAVTTEPGKPEVRSAFTVSAKGDKRYLEYFSPADLKGTRVLVLSASEIYVYLPSFGKVRRVAGATVEQGFMGAVYSLIDLSRTRYSGDYTPSLDPSFTPTAAQVKLAFNAKAGATPAFAKMQVTIARDRNTPTELLFFSADGKKAKTETRSAYSCQGNVCEPGTRTFVDAASKSTTLTRKRWKVNESLSDDTFTQRNLAR